MLFLGRQGEEDVEPVGFQGQERGGISFRHRLIYISHSIYTAPAQCSTMTIGGFSMLSRRGFAGIVAAGFTEFAFAQQSAMNSMNVAAPKGTIWLNGNEFPEGPPAAAIQAITRAAGETNRYHFAEFDS